MAGKKDFSQSLGARARPVAKRKYSFHRPFDDPKPNNAEENEDVIVEEKPKPKKQTIKTAPKKEALVKAEPIPEPEPVAEEVVQAKIEPTPTQVTPKVSQDPDIPVDKYSHKIATQTRHKLDTDSDTNTTQTRHNSDTLPNTNATQTRHNLDTEFATKRDTNSVKIPASVKFILTKIRGNPKKILTFLFEICKANCSTITPELQREYIADSCGIKKGSVKTTIDRLITMGLIYKVNSIQGYWGATSYQLTDEVYKEMLQLEKEGRLEPLTVLQQKGDTKLDTERDTNFYSSSSIYNKTTTTEQTLPENWQYIDFSSLSDIGFQNHHLEQLYNYYLKNNFDTNAEQVQESINHFAFDLANNNAQQKVKSGNILSFFIGIMRNSRYYNPPTNYKSPEEIAREERLRRLREEAEQKRQLEEELKQAGFSKWRKGLSNGEIEELIAEKCEEDKVFAGFIERNGKMVEGKYTKRVEQFLLAHFEENHSLELE